MFPPETVGTGIPFAAVRVMVVGKCGECRSWDHTEEYTLRAEAECACQRSAGASVAHNTVRGTREKQ